MINAMFKSWQSKIGLFLLFACIASLLIAPLLSSTPVPNVADVFNNIAAIAQAKLALAEGQFPLRVAPLESAGWRYPLYQFYSPTGYTLVGLIHAWLFPANPYLAYKWAIWCALVAGGVYMYRLAYWFVKSRSAGVLASVAYLMAPYYIVVISQLGALNEAIALGILPAVLYYTLRCYYYPNSYKSLLQVSLAWYLLATIHFITFICTSLSVGMLLLLMSYQQRTLRKNIFYVGMAYAFSCLLAIWYLAPIMLLANYFMINHSFNSVIMFDMLHLNLMDLFYPIADQYYQAALGIPFVMTIGICVYAVCKKTGFGDELAGRWFYPLFMVFILTFLVAWSPINVWQWMPNSFLVLQYSWRLLGQIMWMGSLLFAWAIYYVFKNTLNVRQTLLGILFIVVTTSSWLPFSKDHFTHLFKQVNYPHLLTANNDSYLIDAYRAPQFIHLIDSVPITDLTKTENSSGLTLRLNSPISIAPASLRSAFSPFISLRGHMPANINRPYQQLVAVVNGSSIATHTLKPGPFHWNIPLDLNRISNKHTTELSVMFKVQEPHAKRLLIPIDKVALEGLLNSSVVLDVKQVQPHCYQQDGTTVCQINVPEKIRLLELPIFYYPGLLHISINGKVVSYWSVFHQGQVIASVFPQPGKMNNITVEFRGLAWANFISAAAWQLWLLLLLFVFLRAMLLRYD